MDSHRLHVAIVGGLAAVASTVGLLAPGVYRDEGIIRDGWVVNDAVTIFVALPVLVLAMRAKARIATAGALHYVLYNYAFYLLGASLNPLFLLYATIVALAFWALVATLKGYEPTAVANAPTRRVAAWALFVAFGLSVTWIAQWATALARTAPASRFDLTPEFVRLVASLDLTMMVSLLVPGAVWLWKGRPWGFVVVGALMVSGAMYNLVLAGGSILQLRAGMAGAAGMTALWIALGAGCALAARALLRTEPLRTAGAWT